jgi:hypothetical protein
MSVASSHEEQSPPIPRVLVSGDWNSALVPRLQRRAECRVAWKGSGSEPQIVENRH